MESPCTPDAPAGKKMRLPGKGGFKTTVNLTS
jgi:hypothetical protein